MGGIGVLLALLGTFAGAAEGPCAAENGVAPPSVRVDQLTINGGGELITLYRQIPNHSEVPVVALLRDTMGDTDLANNRLRYVWILTDRRAPWYKHALAALPFFYSRMPSKLPSPDRKPSPVLDLGKAADRSVVAVSRSLLQMEAFDPMGALVRTSTRSYHLNEEYRQQSRVAEALTALSDLDPRTPSPIAPADVERIRGRLLLSTKTFGGWVGEEGLPRVSSSDITKIEEMRGHNWDLLRQAAELNGFMFEPLRLAGGPPAHAILWVTRADVAANPAGKRFYGRFLRISSPWGDTRLLNWKGYTETREWQGQPSDMIPLAMYSLDHPKTPNLVADMRDALAPSRREMFRRAVTDTTAGVLGVTRTANLELFVAAFAWEFMTSRWGAPNDRSWRVRSYAELRYRLAIDTTLDPALRKDLARRADWLAMNPFEESLDNEVKIARIQHAALVKWAQSPKGAAKKLNQDRREELALLRRTEEKRFWANASRLATFGLYRRRAPDAPATYAELDSRRRVATYMHVLEQVAQSGDAPPEVAWNQTEVRQAVFELGRLKPQDPVVNNLVNKIKARIADSESRTLFMDAWTGARP